MGIFERYLSLWVGLAMVAGVLLGLWQPEGIAQIARFEIAGVNLIVALLIWLMVYPMMLKVDLKSLGDVGRAPRALALTLVINWVVKPLSMLAVAILFFEHLFAGMLPASDAQEYIAGMILLGVAPCTAMVFVWSHLTRGDANYTLVQVSVNDLILVFAFAPLSALLLGVTQVTVPWSTLSASVVIFVLLPLLAALLSRKLLLAQGEQARLDRWSNALRPTSILGLILTVVLLFAFQAPVIVDQPDRVLLIAAPLLVQSYGIFALSYTAAFALRIPFCRAAPAAMIGTSNFFELAVAVAISLFGLQSKAALATVVGVLIEVPVMLSLVAFANRTQRHFPAPEPCKGS